MSDMGFDVDLGGDDESGGGEAAMRAAVDAVENLMRKAESEHTSN